MLLGEMVVLASRFHLITIMSQEWGGKCPGYIDDFEYIRGKWYLLVEVKQAV